MVGFHTATSGYVYDNQYAVSGYTEFIFITADCIKYLYVMAFTSGLRNSAPTRGSHRIELEAKDMNKSKLLKPGKKDLNNQKETCGSYP